MPGSHHGNRSHSLQYVVPRLLKRLFLNYWVIEKSSPENMVGKQTSNTLALSMDIIKSWMDSMPKHHPHWAYCRADFRQSTTAVGAFCS